MSNIYLSLLWEGGKDLKILFLQVPIFLYNFLVSSKIKVLLGILGFERSKLEILIKKYMTVQIREKSLSSIVDFIIMVYHGPLRQNIQHIEYETLQLVKEYGVKFPELKDMGELLSQFKSEVLEHMSREEHEFFPVLRQIEKCAFGEAEFTDCDLKRFEDVIHRLEHEHEHFDTYVYSLVTIFRESDFRHENPFAYDHFNNYYSLLENETMRHTQIENKKLHPLAHELFKKVCSIA